MFFGALLTGDTIHGTGDIMETVEYKNISFTMFDYAGLIKIRPLIRNYFQNAQGRFSST